MKSIFLAVLSQAFVMLSTQASQVSSIESIQLNQVPERSPYALNGVEFCSAINQLSGEDREKAIRSELLAGNMPSFQRLLVPITVQKKSTDGSSIRLTYFVMPDYLAVGSDTNFIRVPINLPSAQLVAQSFGFVLPTRKMVDQIYKAAELKLKPQPMKPGPAMTSTSYFVSHNKKIEQQLVNQREFPGQLLAGHKKDVVQSRRLLSKPSAIAIYGWHRLSTARPIQPLSTIHGAYYADYSHGIRLVSQWALIEQSGVQKLMKIDDVLDSPHWDLISDEGRFNLPAGQLVTNFNG